MSNLLSFTSVLPYFLLMALFWCEAALIQRYVPFFRRALRQETASRNHNVPLDAVRGILALGVFFTHALNFHGLRVEDVRQKAPSHFYVQLAIAAVAMFFMITGYLFWTKAQVKGLRPLRTYFLHRLRRLYPAFLFSSALIVLTALWVRGGVAVPPGTFLRSLLPYVTFELVGGPHLNGLDDAGSINSGVYWTLRVEWMFYFALPLLAIFARKAWKQVLLAVIAVALKVLLPHLRDRIHSPLGLGAVDTLIYFNYFLVAYFSFGMLIAWIKVHYDLGAIARSRIASVVAILLLVVGLWRLPADESPLIAAILTIPLLLVAYGNSYFGLLTSRPMVLLGQASYSIYLLHGIALFAGNRLLASNRAFATSPLVFWSLTAAMGVVVVALAAFSYRWFEAPFMHGYGVRRADLEASNDVPALSTVHS